MEPRLHSPFVIPSAPAHLLAAMAIAGVFLIAGCRQEKSVTPQSLSGNVLAVVGSEVITIETFQNELARRARSSPGKLTDPGEKQALLDEMIRFEVLHQKALAAGYDRDPQIVASVQRMIVTKFEEDQLAKLHSPPATAEEIADFYQKNPQRYGTPAKVRAALIELKVTRMATGEKRAEVAARAAAILAEARTNSPPDHTFGLIAQGHSEHQSSRYRGGDIGWLTVGATNSTLPPAVAEALFKLDQPGETSPVVETPTAFYLVRLVERQPATIRPFAEVKDGVAYLIVRQKEQQRQEELQATLKQGLNIQINQALLDSIAVPRQESKPPAMPGGTTAQVRGDAEK